MPARAPARSARPSTAASRKASSATNPRTSTASRASSVAIDVPAEAPDNELRTRICAIFRDAQKTTATHRKLVVNLRKLQEACCYEPVNPKKHAAGDFSDEEFNAEFVRCVLRIMPVRKAESVGDKVTKFVGMFLRYASEKDGELLGEIDEDASIMPETPTIKLTTILLDTVLPFLTSKDKFVRYRSTQMISHVVNSLDTIDDGLFERLRHGLLKRIRDKEAMVRAQAVLGLGRLVGNQEEGSDDPDGSEDDSDRGLLKKLLEVMQNDPSADVRRSLLANLPIVRDSLPYLMERARDQDPATRRAVYSRLLPSLGDFRYISVNMREKLLRWGLRDRDENVRKAAARLFREHWIEHCMETPPAEDETQESSTSNFNALLELLERIDVENSGVENGVALEAMKSFWEGRPDYRDAVSFDDQFWETLSAESAFLARSFNDFCRTEGNGKFESLVEEKLPEVTKLAFYLERYIQALVEALRHIASAESVEAEEEEAMMELDFIVQQLLHIALTLDYSDEVGRRKMFALLRQTLSIPELPDEVTKLTIDVLRDMCAHDAAGEREFCSIVLESVADVHDTIVDDPPMDDAEDSFHSAKSEVSSDSASTRDGSRSKDADLSEEEAREKAIKEILINMKCLHIVQCMLSNVAGTLQENDHLVSMLNNLVVPAVRSHEAPVRERGLVCLGLCSLLDKSLAEENLMLFMHFFSKGHAALQITALHILTDILNVHGAQLLSANPTLLKVYVRALKSGTKAPEVQAAATLAVSKLLLGRVVTDPEASAELLKTLVVAYFDPVTASNQSVRQALNYFLPVFCYSRAENQQLMGSVTLDAIHSLFNVREGLEDDDADVEDEMASLSTIGACLVDWTDPRKCYSTGLTLESEKKHVNGDVHLDLAQAILDKLNGNMSKDEKKVIAPLIGKLYISPASTEDKIRSLYEEVDAAVDSKLVADAASRNALYKIHVSLGKIVNTLAEAQQQQDATLRAFSRSVSVATSVYGDERSVVDEGERTVVAAPEAGDETTIKEEEDEEEEGNASDATVVQHGREQDTLVDDLLSDEEVL